MNWEQETYIRQQKIARALDMMPIAHKPAPVFIRSKPFPSVMIEIGHSYEGIFEAVKEIPGDAVIESITPTEDGQAVVLTFTESE